MATPKPGEIRCPTCHRSTPPAAFCTQCGSVIPADARIRPRGMDRDELQDRIRARRSGGEPFHRGSDAEEGTGIYERFEPDPTDAMARRPAEPQAPRRDMFEERAAASAPEPPPAEAPRDLVRDPDDFARAAPPPAQEPPAGEPAPLVAPLPPWGESDQPAEPAPEAEPAYVDNFDDAAYGEPAYDYEAWDEPQRSGGGVLPVLGFLGLGVLALVAGAVIANLMGSAGVGSASPTPSVSIAPSIEPSVAPSVEPTATPEPSGSAVPSDGPIVFPDGFTAEAQTCLPGTANNRDGCNSNAAVNAGSVEIWVGFNNGTRNDVIGATLVAPDGRESDASIDLAGIGCRSSCNGYTWFNFSNLVPGVYEVRVTRNGEPAATTSFEVT